MYFIICKIVPFHSGFTLYLSQSTLSMFPFQIMVLRKHCFVYCEQKTLLNSSTLCEINNQRCSQCVNTVRFKQISNSLVLGHITHLLIVTNSLEIKPVCPLELGL